MQTEAVWRALPRKIREVLAEKDLHDLQEIRLRSGQPLLLKRENRLFSLGKEGVFLPAADEKGMRISMADLRETVSLLSGYSLYAFEEELRQGYLTIEGGHRVGFCGKAVLENGEIRTLRQINALNIRIARERKGCLLRNWNWKHLSTAPCACRCPGAACFRIISPAAMRTGENARSPAAGNGSLPRNTARAGRLRLAKPKREVTFSTRTIYVPRRLST